MYVCMHACMHVCIHRHNPIHAWHGAHTLVHAFMTRDIGRTSTETHSRNRSSVLRAGREMEPFIARLVRESRAEVEY